uniref:C2H2-type domain-containing protein n=1 Tax=Oryza punctata TaxID=4537 RepID=A0A0E0LMY8_ORYPU
MEGNNSSSNDSLHSRRAEEIEEGEICNPGGGGGYYDSGSETEEEEEEAMRPETCKRRRLEYILELPSPTPSSSGSEGTISDRDHGGDDAAPVAARREASFPCHLCNKEFGSRKAVHGHMRVHQAKEKEPPSSLHHAPPPQPTTAPAVQHLAPLPGAYRSGGPYRCKYECCGMEYKTHQGLGGHVAGHINRDKLAAGAGKPEGKHPCNVCGKEYLTGVALGGHKRKHYKKDLDLTLSLAPPPTSAPAPAAIAAAALPPAETEAEVAEHGDGAEPVPATPATGVRRNAVRIFGVDVEKPVDNAEEQDERLKKDQKDRHTEED